MSGKHPINLPDEHHYVDLSGGRCHYRQEGPADGPTVLMLHGATVPGWEFDRLVPYLHSNGYRTVCPDFFGHGYSTRPNAALTQEMFVEQVAEFVASQPPEPPAHIVAHSLGAAVAARFACRNPEAVGRLVLLAPLLDFLSVNKSTRLLRIPLLGELLMPTYVVPALVRRRRRRYQAISDGRFVGKFKDQLRVPGFGRSLLSMIRSGALADQSDCYRKLANLEKDVLVLRGSRDTIFLEYQFEAMRALLPDGQFQELTDLEHPFMLTHPERVGPIITDFLD